MIEIDMPVHPAAAVFPMLSEDELRDLADDIRANGLRHPIVLGPDGEIRDGRNRYVACRMADVEPTFTTHDGDPLALILSENIRRRHLSRGQQAVAIALMIETEEGKRDGQSATLSLDSKLSRAHVAQAVTIRRYAPDLAPLVLSGAERFDSAYATARRRKQEMLDDERKLAEAETKLAKLRAEAPDLAALVDEWRISVDDALAALRQRREEEEREQRSATQLLMTVLEFLAPMAGDLGEHVALTASRVKLGSVAGSDRITAERIDRARDFLDRLRPSIEDQERRRDDGRRQPAFR